MLELVTVMLVAPALQVELVATLSALPALLKRPIMIVGFILLLGGIQLITTGIIAEIIVRTYFESQNKKTYSIKTVFQGERLEVKSIKSEV